MTAPDLDTSEGLAAYRAELKGVARRPRLAGLAAIVVGAGFVLLSSQRVFGLTPQSAVYGYAALAFGWVLLVVAFILRNRYHRRRMAQLSEPSLSDAVRPREPA